MLVGVLIVTNSDVIKGEPAENDELDVAQSQQVHPLHCYLQGDDAARGGCGPNESTHPLSVTAFSCSKSSNHMV